MGSSGQGHLLRPRDISALFCRRSGGYIAANAARGSTDDNEAVVEHPQADWAIPAVGYTVLNISSKQVASP